MRILNVEASYFVSHFRRLGHEVLTIGPGRDSDVVQDRPLGARELLRVLEERKFRPDLALWADGCRPPSVLGLELLPCVTMGYSIDQYCNPWHVPWSACFDLFWVAQKDYVPLFNLPQLRRPVRWFPLFFNAEGLSEVDAERDIPVGFVGTVSGSINRERKRFLDDFRMMAPLVAVQGAYRPVYARCQLVLNQSAAAEVNFRVFEGAGCGALVVTERVDNGLSELFESGVEIAVYERGNAAHAAQTCRALLQDHDRRQRMAAAGRRRVMREHTAAARAREILDAAATMAAQRSWTWRRDNQAVVQTEIGKMCLFLGLDQELPLPWDMAQGYCRMGMERMGRR